MLFRSAIAFAVLAGTASAAAEPQPYRPAMMPVLGMSLGRRDTSGYIPDQTQCGDGTTCAEACGQGYTECAANGDTKHCYNPDKAQKCCGDGTGNSCEKGFYCTNDSANQTWCCPDSMDLAQCAAAYSISGSLHTPKVTSSSASKSSTSTSSAPSSSSSSAASTTSAPASITPTPSPSSTPSSSKASTPVSTPGSGSNSTATSKPVVTVSSTVVVGPGATSAIPTGGASIAGVAMPLLLAAAGFAALL
ncbi:unnamed protein product [Clonostachys rosea f. rosea IK726]|uniref:Prp 4 CRoW domain-containing protein n=2 Tax=Bionectria ochroleuca TaxID=29856 RepID=A0A0B7JLS2_BIOOC|nr:unnamed protein product [Clonostachys rosea f. rosea IK726]